MLFFATQLLKKECALKRSLSLTGFSFPMSSILVNIEYLLKIVNIRSNFGNTAVIKNWQRKISA